MVIPNIVHGMKEWEYTFSAVSKEEWIRQIEADLRHKPVESLQSEWWPGEVLIPLVHQDDVNGAMVKLPDTLFSHPPLIAERIPTKGLTALAVNKNILEALGQGVQSIILLTETSGDIQIAAWLNGVMEEIISIAIQPDDISVLSLPTFESDRLKNLKVRMVRDHLSLPLSSLLDQLKPGDAFIQSLRLVYCFPSSGVWDYNTAVIFNQLLDDLSTWVKQGFDATAFWAQCILAMEADKQYFKHIIQARVLHLLWMNLMELFGNFPTNGHHHYLECHIMDDHTEQPEHFLVRASMSGLAASLTGSQTLCIYQADNPEVYKRVNRNIHHLLNLESGMYKGTDPLAGAYAIDFHTKLWTMKIWEKLSIEK